MQASQDISAHEAFAVLLTIKQLLFWNKRIVVVFLDGIKNCFKLQNFGESGKFT